MNVLVRRLKMRQLGRFYPTRLATTLTSSAPPLVASQHASGDRGFLILETNYRTYAYTSNPLQIAVLNLFTTLRYRFPNLVVGAITRESIKAALANGITASQIVAYLSTHAHPQMRKQDPLLPPTVVDQIKLWELEKNRIRDQEGQTLPLRRRLCALNDECRLLVRGLQVDGRLRPGRPVRQAARRHRLGRSGRAKILRHGRRPQHPARVHQASHGRRRLRLQRKQTPNPTPRFASPAAPVDPFWAVPVTAQAEAGGRSDVFVHISDPFALLPSRPRSRFSSVSFAASSPLLSI